MAATAPVRDQALLEELAAIIEEIDSVRKRALNIYARLEDRIDIDESKAALEEARTAGTVPWEQVKAKLEL